MYLFKIQILSFLDQKPLQTILDKLEVCFARQDLHLQHLIRKENEIRVAFPT